MKLLGKFMRRCFLAEDGILSAVTSPGCEALTEQQVLLLTDAMCVLVPRVLRKSSEFRRDPMTEHDLVYCWAHLSNEPVPPSILALYYENVTQCRDVLFLRSGSVDLIHTRVDDEDLSKHELSVLTKLLRRLYAPQSPLVCLLRAGKPMSETNRRRAVFILFIVASYTARRDKRMQEAALSPEVGVWPYVRYLSNHLFPSNELAQVWPKRRFTPGAGVTGRASRPTFVHLDYLPSATHWSEANL